MDMQKNKEYYYHGMKKNSFCTLVRIRQNDESKYNCNIFPQLEENLSIKKFFKRTFSKKEGKIKGKSNLNSELKNLQRDKYSYIYHCEILTKGQHLFFITVSKPHTPCGGCGGPQPCFLVVGWGKWGQTMNYFVLMGTNTGK